MNSCLYLNLYGVFKKRLFFFKRKQGCLFFIRSKKDVQLEDIQNPILFL